MRRVMKYIKPETTVVKADGMLLLSGSPVEVGKADPTKSLGSDDEGNIVMSKGGWPFGEEVENEWPESKSLWDE
jgi:hypothetical protein